MSGRGGCRYVCVNSVGRREGGFTCIDALLDSKKDDIYINTYRRCVGGMRGGWRDPVR